MLAVRRRVRAQLAAMALAAALPAGLIVTPSAAHGAPGEVRDAKEQVAAMQAKVARVAAELERGTQAYRDSRRRLVDVQRRERAARRESARLRAEWTGQQDRLDRVVAATFRRPVPGVLSAMVGGDFAVAMIAKADLEHVAGSQQDVLRGVVRSRTRAEQLAREAEQLAAEAGRAERRVASQLGKLRSTATRAETELQEAARALERAQQRERERLAALEQARLDALERSRAAAAARAACGRSPSEGYANGFMPDIALCGLWQAPGERLRQDAAVAFNRMSRYYSATTGAPLCVTDSYRSYSRQVAIYRRTPELAAAPGTSEHGWGRAVDLCGGVQRFGSDAYLWMQANAGAFGFFHPEWAEPEGSNPEPWHWEYSG